MNKMRGKAIIPVFRVLKDMDPGIQPEKTFEEWLFLPKLIERTHVEKSILDGLRSHCSETKDSHSKKSECDCKGFYTDEKITGKTRKLEFDLYLPKYNIAIEFDEKQHFTKERLFTYKHYPSVKFYYDIGRWKELCNSGNRNDSDPPCRDWQRAYRDAIRDLRAQANGVTLIRLYDKDFSESALRSSEVQNQLKGMIKSMAS